MSQQSVDGVWLRPYPAQLLNGEEKLAGVNATVAEFWRWAFSDLRDNTTRGVLAEFLVAKAIDDKRAVRVGWGNFDVLAPDGTRIEVKCSAYLQSWSQREHSQLVFGRLAAREFDANRNEYSADVRIRADVFVFAIQTQREPSAYDMLDITHWQFWVASAQAVSNAATRTVTIGWVRSHATGPLSYDELAEAIYAAARMKQ